MELSVTTRPVTLFKYTEINELWKQYFTFRLPADKTSHG